MELLDQDVHVYDEGLMYTINLPSHKVIHSVVMSGYLIFCFDFKRPRWYNYKSTTFPPPTFYYEKNFKYTERLKEWESEHT